MKCVYKTSVNTGNDYFERFYLCKQIQNGTKLYF